jgi:hypothetical protein
MYLPLLRILALLGDKVSTELLVVLSGAACSAPGGTRLLSALPSCALEVLDLKRG